MSYSGQYSRVKRKSGRNRPGWRWVMVIAVMALLTAATIFVVRGARNNAGWWQDLGEMRGRLTTWVAERKQHLNRTVASVRKATGERDESERVVNFEFYNTLQEMKSMQVEAQAEVNKSQEQKLSGKPVEKPVVISAVKAKKSVKISQAADLEKDLLAAMNQKNGSK